MSVDVFVKILTDGEIPEHKKIVIHLYYKYYKYYIVHDCSHLVRMKATY